MPNGGTRSRDHRRGPIVRHPLRRARLRAPGALVVAALLVTVAACASSGPSGPPEAGPPLPQGVAVSVGVDGDGSFYSFASDLGPSLALAAYAATLEGAGYAPTGAGRGWERFSDGRRTIAARAEPGPPSMVLVRELTGAGGPGMPVAPTATTTPGGSTPASPAASGPTPDGATPATPKPTTPGTSDTKPGRRPDPPHGTSTGLGNDSGKGNAGGGKPDPTPRPTKAPKP